MNDSTPVLSFAPVRLQAPERGTDLDVRVSMPASGTGLPVIVFAHGFGWSMNAYAPLVDHWASHGFVVIQPTFLDSRTLGLAPEDPRTPNIWRTRLDDLTQILDQLDLIEERVPGLAGRIDRSKIAAVGHSYGAQTVGMLLGARVRGADGMVGESVADARISAGVLLSATGDGDSLTAFAAQYFGFMRPDFTEMSTPALIVAGDHDDSPLSTRGPDWFTDAFALSPAPKTLLTVIGGEHSLGGISGYDVAETTDADSARIALVQRATLSWLQAHLHGQASEWDATENGIAEETPVLGRLDSK
jgi:dienelactone hydrolase